MNQFFCTLVLILLGGFAWADDRLACEAVDGIYRSGMVIKGPVFAHGPFRQGVELSHTHLSLLADQDGQAYDVAIDNVFANGYDPRQGGIPASLNAITRNERIELCGALYTQGSGLHFVHTNCGAPLSPVHPDGWLKAVSGDGTVGANLEANTAFCGLF